MDRAVLIKLFQDGMRYPPGTRRLWVSRCFEVTVRPDQVVEVDEYEGVAIEGADDTPRTRCAHDGEMLHRGRSRLDLKDGRVIEQPRAGSKPRD